MGSSFRRVCSERGFLGQLGKMHRLVSSLLVLLISLAFTEGFFNPTAVGGIGLGNCPRSCLTACRAANFAATTSCTYTYISRPILGVSTSVTKSCTQCYPIVGPILG